MYTFANIVYTLYLPGGRLQVWRIFLFSFSIVHWDFGQTNEEQCRVNHLPISDLYGEVDSIQTSLKPLFTLKQLWNVVFVFQLFSLAFSVHHHCDIFKHN
jgi:hypothetical protein